MRRFPDRLFLAFPCRLPLSLAVLLHLVSDMTTHAPSPDSSTTLLLQRRFAGKPCGSARLKQVDFQAKTLTQYISQISFRLQSLRSPPSPQRERQAYQEQQIRTQISQLQRPEQRRFTAAQNKHAACCCQLAPTQPPHHLRLDIGDLLIHAHLQHNESFPDSNGSNGAYSPPAMDRLTR